MNVKEALACGFVVQADVDQCEFSLTINGKTFTFGCVQEPETENIAVDVEAMRERFTKSIHVSKFIGYTPAVGQLLTIEEKVWRVSQYTSEPAVYHLVLLSENE